MKRLLIATAFLFITFLYITPQSHAQSGYEWTCDFNFIFGDQGWVAQTDTTPTAYALYSSSLGWKRNTATATQARLSIIAPSFGSSSVTVSSATVTFSKTNVIGTGGSSFLGYKDDPIYGGTTWATVYTAGQTLQTYTYNATSFVVPSGKRFHVGNGNASGTNGTAFPTDLYITRVQLSGNGTKPSLSQCAQNYVQLTAPMTAGNISATYDPIGDTAQGMYWSAPGNVFVNAMLSGTVSDISIPSCSELYPYISNTPLVCSFDFNGTTIVPNSNDQYRVITINHASGYKIKQLVKATSVFVSVNQSINANCPIGLAFDVSPFSSGKYTHDWLIDMAGSKVQYTGTYIPATDTSYCGAPVTEVSQCLGDATFQLGQWQSSGAVTIDELGVRLGSGAEIKTQMTLPSGAYTELKVSGGTDIAGILKVQLGTTVQTFNLPTTVLLAEAVRTPDIGSFYTVALKNMGATTIRISYACVRVTRDSGGTVIDPPPTYVTTQNCVLSNSNFASLGTGWSKSDTFKTVTFSNSQAHIPFGEYIYQSITLQPGTYTLTLKVSIDYTTQTLAFNTDSINVLYSFPSTTPTTVVGGAFALSSMQANNLKEISVQITVATKTTGNFYIQAQSSSTSATGVAISSACITGTGISSLGSCTTIPTPIGTTFGEWTTWLWSNFAKFFDCQLMPTLNDMNNIISRQFVMLGWSIRYQLASADMWTQWLGAKFLPWLAGYLSNIQPGTAYVQTQCNDLFCVIANLFSGITAGFNALGDGFNSLASIVGDITKGLIAVVDLINNIINDMTAIILSINNTIQSSFGTAQNYIGAITNAFQNATPAVIPILPTCTANPKSNGFCIVSWMLQNTILSGTGALFIPLLISFSSILWMLWAIKETKQVIYNIGSSI